MGNCVFFVKIVSADEKMRVVIDETERARDPSLSLSLSQVTLNKLDGRDVNVGIVLDKENVMESNRDSDLNT